MAVAIADPHQLRAAVSARYAARVQLRLAELGVEEAQNWENSINGQLDACGCLEGTVGLLGGLAVGIAIAPIVWPGWGKATAVAVLAALAGAVAGKMVGKIRGRRTARRLAEELARLIEQRQTVEQGSQR